MELLYKVESFIEKLKELSANHQNIAMMYTSYINDDSIILHFNDMKVDIQTDDVESVPATLVSKISKAIIEASQEYELPVSFTIAVPDAVTDTEFDYDYDDNPISYDVTRDYVFYVHDSDDYLEDVVIEYPKNESLQTQACDIVISNGVLNVNGMSDNLVFNNQESVSIINKVLGTTLTLKDPEVIKREVESAVALLKDSLPVIKAYGNHLLTGQIVATTDTYLTLSHEYQGGDPFNETNLVLELDTLVANYDVINDRRFEKRLEKLFPGYLLINSNDGFNIPHSRHTYNNWKYRHHSTNIRPWVGPKNVDSFWEYYLKDAFELDFLRKYHLSSSGIKIKLKLNGKYLDHIVSAGVFDNTLVGFDSDGQVILVVNHMKPKKNCKDLVDKFNNLLKVIYN